jgi:enamine deaminase RidA (YjgF/YER057c/UK114 family)
MVNPAGVAPPVAAYSHLAIVPAGTRLLFLAGQIGNRPDGSLAGSVEDQMIQAYENIRSILASQGAGPQHIAKVMIYASAEPTDWPKLRAHRRAFFGDRMPPPSTWVYVRQLARPNYLVEVEVVATVPNR